MQNYANGMQMAVKLRNLQLLYPIFPLLRINRDIFE
jgi:hypothetical protein